MKYAAVCLTILFALSAGLAQQQQPSKSLPFDDADVEYWGKGTYGTADKTTGHLDGSVHVKSGGSVTYMGGAVRPFVRWSFGLGGTEEVRASVALKYAVTPGGVQADAVDPTAGSGMADYAIELRVIDRSNTSDSIIYTIERRGSGQVLIPFDYSNNYRGQQITLTFRPGRQYYIDACLTVRASSTGGQGVGMMPSPGGTASAAATADIQSMQLFTLGKPWIRCRVTDLYSPTHDTYDRYEQGLKQALKRDYFAAGAYVEISAGGRYDANSSTVAIDTSPAPFLRVKDCPLANTVSPTSVALTLPDCFSLPLEGKTWRFLALHNPEFQTLADNVDLGPPLFKPVFETMFDVGNLQLAAREPVARALTPAQPAGRPTIGWRDFYDLSHWQLVLPLSRFEQLFRPSKTTIKGKPNNLTVQLYTPPKTKKPTLVMPALTVKPASTIKFADPAHEFTTEPQVLVSLLELWKLLCLVQLPNGLELCANPPFIKFLERLAGDAEAYREYLDNLYLRTPDGKLYKLTDLDDERPSPSVWLGGDADDPTPIWLPRRVRRWIRRAAVVGGVAALWAQSRPTQMHAINLHGHVQNTAGQYDNAQDARSYAVVYDLVPRQQPWAVGTPTVMLP